MVKCHVRFFWGITVPIIGAVTPTHSAPAIVVRPPGGEPPNRVAAEKHISSALTAFSVAPVQDRACALELVEFAPETLARDVLLHAAMGPCGSSLKQFAFNMVPGMAQATRCLLPLDDFFSTPADTSKLYWMCPPIIGFPILSRKFGKINYEPSS